LRLLFDDGITLGVEDDVKDTSVVIAADADTFGRLLPSPASSADGSSLAACLLIVGNK
jgi:hypothetical protein